MVVHSPLLTNMINIDVLTLGNELKNDSNELFKVTSNFSEGKKMYVELERVEAVVPPEDEIIKEM